MITEKQSKAKVRGFLGWFRLSLFSLSLAFHFVWQIGVSAVVGYQIAISTAKMTHSFVLAIAAGFFGIIGTFIAIHLIVPLIRIRKDDYYVRPMTEEEYSQYKARNLIHYTDYISDNEFSHFLLDNQVNLSANGSHSANYSMRPEDQSGKYVWFHPSDFPGSDDPDIKSFWTSHSTESTPRRFKIVLRASTFSKNELMIRPWDHAILIRGDYVGPFESISTKFNWYNEKLYLLRCLYLPFKDACSVFFIAYLQRKGGKMDRRLKREQNSSKETV